MSLGPRLRIYRSGSEFGVLLQHVGLRFQLERALIASLALSTSHTPGGPVTVRNENALARGLVVHLHQGALEKSSELRV